MDTRSRSRTAAFSALLVLAPITAWLLVMEIGIRAWRGALTSPPAASEPVLELHRSRYPTSYDPVLGYVPRRGARLRVGRSRRAITITPEGLRANGAPRPSGAAILAIGDSFTFGDEVADRETWPARLEQLLGRPVLNGGVFGYGLDQMVLRAERLLEHLPAEFLIVSLIPDDVLRCEFAYRYAWKPYFEIEAGALELRNQPVPRPETARPPRSPLLALARHSHLADLIYRRLDPTAWVLRGVRRVHRRGSEVAVLLVDRLVALRDAQGIGLLLVVQWLPGSGESPVEPALARARELGVDVLRLEPGLRAALGGDQAELPRLFQRAPGLEREFEAGHMSADGNRLVAELIAPHVPAPGGGAGAPAAGATIAP